GCFLSAPSDFLWPRARPAFSSFSWSSLLILARSSLSSLWSLLVSYLSSNSFLSLRCSSVGLGRFLLPLSASAARTRAGVRPPSRETPSANVSSFFIVLFLVRALQHHAGQTSSLYVGSLDAARQGEVTADSESLILSHRSDGVPARLFVGIEFEQAAFLRFEEQVIEGTEAVSAFVEARVPA